MGDWLRIAIISSCTISYMGGVTYGGVSLDTPVRLDNKHCSQSAQVTFHSSREDAIKAEMDFRKAPYSKFDTWHESWMEWSGDSTRGVFLVHGKTVEQLTFEPKTKKVTKVVEEPDGEVPVTKKAPDTGTISSAETPSKFLREDRDGTKLWRVIDGTWSLKPDSGASVVSIDPKWLTIPTMGEDACLKASDVEKGIYKWVPCPK